MQECFKCGISEEKALLFDAISDKGIIKICRRCNEEEKLPLIRKHQKIESKKENIYERFSSVSNFGKDYKKKFLDNEREELLKKQETSLREIVDKNFREKIPEKIIQNNLIDNFHWVLMRVRRSKKLTQKQLAEELAEPEIAIKMAEQGIIPEDSFNLIKKLENYLGVNISKKPEIPMSPSYSEEIDVVKQEIKERFEEEVSFDEFTTRNLTISDLQEIKDKKENKDSEKIENKLEDKKDLTEEEMNEIIFGKR